MRELVIEWLGRVLEMMLNILPSLGILETKDEMN
jgi:hypothetical protein